jgi:hypothetical protein
VLTGEQQRGPLTKEVLLQGRGIALELRLEVRVGRLVEELQRGFQILRARKEVVPGLDLRPQVIRLAENGLRRALVVPERRFLGQRVQLGDALLLGLEVKDAPRSTGSVQPGRGWRTRPPSSGPGDPGAGSAAAR